MADDAVKVAPQNFTVVIENDRVRVLDFRDRPGETIPMHSHPDLVAVALNGRFRSTSENGDVNENELEPGVVSFTPARSHSTENVGDSDGHVILVELK